MRKVENYKGFLLLREQQEAEGSKNTTAGMLEAYKEDGQARSNISGAILANAS